MKTSFFVLIGLAFPNSDIRFSTLGAELYDKNSEMIGYIPNREIFILRSEYTHKTIAQKTLIEHGVNHKTESGAEALYS